MVCVDLYLLTQKNISEFFQGFYNGKEFLLSSCVSPLCRIELSAVEGYWFPVLADYCAELRCAGVGVYIEHLIKIRVR